MKVYKSNRVEALLDPLAATLARPLADPFAKEQIVVHSAGMERWLTLELAQRLEIAANLEFPYPGRVVQQAFEAALGMEKEQLKAWDSHALLWAVLAGLDELIDTPTFKALQGYVAHDPKGLKRYQLAVRITRVFDRYGTYRPELCLSWMRGGGEPTDWQPVLYRWLREHIGQPSIAELMQRFEDRLVHPKAQLKGLPERISVFGVTTLPPLFVRIFALLSRHLDVQLFLLNPSDSWWADIRNKRQIQRGLFESPQVAQDALAMEEGHPLLASLGKLGRDFQQVLEEAVYQEPMPELFQDPGQGSLLHAVQSDVLHLQRRGPEHPHHILRDADASIQIHACHGPMRQVQVLQDQLLHLFDTLPGLEPRDVVVQLPDVEGWAPMVRAVFDRAEDDPRFIPFKVADRSLKRGNPAAQALLAILDMVGGRAQCSSVLALLSFESVRERFGILAQDLDLLTEWSAQAGIRWGWDAEHRAAHGQPKDPQNTWRFGLRRLLLGVAMRGDDKRMWSGILPFDEIEGSIARQLGRFVDFVHSLKRSMQSLENPRDLPSWNSALTQVLERMISLDEDNAWQHLQVREILNQASEHADAQGMKREVDLALVQAHLGQAFDESRPASGFIGGKLLFCGMVPMRTIPFRVVCMLGMDEHAFPRMGQQLGFDWMHIKPRVGDRSAREDDRYLFLESLLSARERLILSYTGLGVRDNKELPPSVVVSELLDTIAETCGQAPVDPLTEEAVDWRSKLVQHHPLQPFSPRSFAKPSFSYASDYLKGAQALLEEKHQLPPFFPSALPSTGPRPEITIAELARFWAGPTQSLMRQGLGIRTQNKAIEIQDREPIELSALELYLIAQPLLGRSLAGETLAQAFESVRAQGVLPLGTPGKTRYSELNALLGPLAEAVGGFVEGGAQPPVTLSHKLGEHSLVGSLSDLYPWGRVLYQYKRIRSAHLVSLWVEHLALQLLSPRKSMIVGRPESGGGIMCLAFRPVDQPEAILKDLLHLWELGQRYPLLFFPDTSRTWAHKALSAKGPRDLERAMYPTQRKWRSYNGLFKRESGDGTQEQVARVMGSSQPWDPDLATAKPEGLGFFELASRVCDPMLRHMYAERK